uniref:Uncharacterized protein n=1 Tax=Romanomermis culicivorax TaxID=13658 RepID=A0A915KBS1_ROMCU
MCPVINVLFYVLIDNPKYFAMIFDGNSYFSNTLFEKDEHTQKVRYGEKLMLVMALFLFRGDPLADVPKVKNSDRVINTRDNVKRPSISKTEVSLAPCKKHPA